MAESAAFDFSCSELEQRTSLDRLEARGTIRLAIKQAGLEAKTVTPDQMKVVVDKILPDELRSRGIDDVDGTCRSLQSGLARLDVEASAETPDAVFQRLGGS